MKTSKLLSGVLSFIAGACGSYAFAPYDFYWLIFLSLGIFFYLSYSSQDKKAAFIVGYCFGLGFFGFGIHWLYISINLFGGVNLIGAYCITGILILFHGLYTALFALVIHYLKGRLPKIILLFSMAAVWTLIEWSRTWMLTGFPWLAVGYSQTDSILASFGPILGVYGISFIISLICSSFILMFIKSDKFIFTPLMIIIAACSLAFAMQKINWTDEKPNTWKVALIQAGIPQELKWVKEYRQKTIDLYRELSDDYWGYDLLLWPETALPFFYHDGKAVINELSDHAINTDTELLLGIPYSDPDSTDYFNSIISIGESSDIYLKRHLVPFGEYLPLDKYIRPILNYLKIPMSSFSAGIQEKPLMKIKNEYVGLSICYEDVFGEEVIDALPDASILVNVSNDAWFGDSAAPHQHLQMARMRSIETGRYLLRATNNGVSAIINEKGKLLQTSPQFVAYAMSAEVKLFRGSTPYAKMGNTAIVVVCLVIMIIAVLSRSGRRSLSGR